MATTNPHVADIIRDMPIRPDSYVDIPAWLLARADEYHLTTKESVLLALIYGRTHDGKPHAIPISTAAAWAGYERRGGAASALRKLTNLGFIAKGPKLGAENTYVAKTRPTAAEYKASHYCRLYWWMIADYGLSLAEAMLYATVHSFWAAAKGNPDQAGCLYAAVDTICAWLRLGHSTVCDGLRAITQRGLVTKTPMHTARGRVYEYRIVPAKLPAAMRPAKGKSKPAEPAADEPTERERKIAAIDAEKREAMRKINADANRRKYAVDHPDADDSDYYAHRDMARSIGADNAGYMDYLRRHPELRDAPVAVSTNAYLAERGREKRAIREERVRRGV